ncbi:MULTISPECIES: glycosyltransferase family 4 protein [unclassified Marinobacter]|uniref:glycosyltransferase family 4 protein n=1 Tax=unclassified Marinobacter TaxID=83889 RepID=UPI0018F1FAEA|nr:MULTISPECIES: glycosyltransferase family 4 protein [unclassified Marinobacter]
MNILYVHNVGKIGGAERVTLDIIRGLGKGSHRAFLVTPEEGPFLEFAREIGAATFALNICQPDLKKPIQTLKGYLRWLKFLRKHEIDLIHTGDLFVTRTLIAAANTLFIPLICHVHCAIETTTLAWIFKAKPKRCCFIYCSQDFYDSVSPLVKPKLGHSEHIVIHNGVDTELFRPRITDQAFLPKGRFNIGIIGNLQKFKGHDDLIDAINIVRITNPDILLHIIGDDFFGESRKLILRKRVEQDGLQDFVFFHGHIDNIWDYLNDLDLVVCASHQEGFPVSILEAMAFAKPIISTNVNGIPEAIVDGESGLLVKPSSADELAAKINLLISNRKLRHYFAVKARQRVLDNFSLDKFFSKIQNLYNEKDFSK